MYLLYHFNFVTLNFVESILLELLILVKKCDATKKIIIWGHFSFTEKVSQQKQ